jgi:hypothetical protein
MEESPVSEADIAAILEYRLEELSCYVKSGVQHQSFVMGNRWWLVSHPDGIHDTLIGALILTEQNAQNKNCNQDDEELPGLKLFGGAPRRFHPDFERSSGKSLGESDRWPPYNSKHNPYYGDRMNGGDITQLLEGLVIVCNAMRDASTIQEMEDHLDKHAMMWLEIAKVSPLLRTTIKLDQNNRDDLKQRIRAFDDANKKNTSAAPTPNMHHIAVHTEHLLDTYHTFGLFPEDSME